MLSSSTSSWACVERGLAPTGVVPQLVAGLLELVDLLLGPLPGAGEGGEDVDELLLSQSGVDVVGLGDADLGHRGEPEHAEQQAHHDLAARRPAQAG